MHELTFRPNIESFLAQEENLEVFEDCLDRVAQEFLELERGKGKLDFGPKLTPEILRVIAPPVIKETKEFLGVDKIGPIQISMFDLYRSIKVSAYLGLGTFEIGTLYNFLDGAQFSDLKTPATLGLIFGFMGVLEEFKKHIFACYDRGEEKMFLSRDEGRIIPAVGTIIHEYAHHVQRRKAKDIVKWRNPICEGHARGVERAVSRVFAERFDEPAYLYHAIERTAKELKDAYTYICETRGKNPKKSLKGLPIPNVRGWCYKIMGHHYSIGTAAMCISEALHGPKVYRSVIGKNFSFLKA